MARELRLRLKLALDELGVSVPSLNRMVLDQHDATLPQAPNQLVVEGNDEGNDDAARAK